MKLGPEIYRRPSWPFRFGPFGEREFTIPRFMRAVVTVPIYVTDSSVGVHLCSFAIAVDLLFALSFAQVLAAHMLPRVLLLLAKVR
jgi:hypothetical protein